MCASFSIVDTFSWPYYYTFGLVLLLLLLVMVLGTYIRKHEFRVLRSTYWAFEGTLLVVLETTFEQSPGF